MTTSDPLAAPHGAARRAESDAGKPRTSALLGRSLLGFAGFTLLLGFFLPWITIGRMVALSGFGLLISGGESTQMFSGPPRALLFLVPLAGFALAACAYTGHRISNWVALVASFALLAYGAFTLIWLFIGTTGLGMWLVVLAALLTFAVSLVSLGKQRGSR
jgi:hypothetical protein